MGCAVRIPRCCETGILETETKEGESNYIGETYQAKVVDTYDGDTITIVFIRRGERREHRVRMMGYDSPEMKPLKSKPNRVAEKRAAVAARDSLADQFELSGNFVVVEFVSGARGKPDPYGRPFVEVYLPATRCGCGAMCCRGACCGTRWVCCGGPSRRRGLHLNRWMVENRYGVEYDGGKKPPFNPDTANYGVV